MSDLDAMVRRIVGEEVDRRLAAVKQAAPQPEQLLSAAAVATLLGKSRRALDEAFRRARACGGQHPIEQMVLNIDGARRWRRSDVLAWIDSQAKGAR